MTVIDKGPTPNAAQHLAALVESSDDAIISKTLDGTIQTWNQGAERLFGYRAEEIIGKPVLTLFPPDREHEEEIILGKLKNRKRIEHYETVRRRKDGTLVDVSLSVSPILDDMGNVVGGSKIARDVSERKRIDAIAQHFAAIVESSHDAIISKNLNGIIQSWNSAAERMFGYSADEIVGKSVLVLIPADRQHEETEILRRIRAGERIEHFETVRQHKDGSLLDISLTISPVKDSEGQIVGASKIARDIREKKRAEAIRETLLNEIKHRVKNTLGTVQAVASQTFKSASEQEHRAFTLRLQAMSHAHDLLTLRDWESADLGEIVDQALKPFCDGPARLTKSGPSVELNPSKTLLVAMILHELGTNAVKYGALSNTTGHIDLTWDITTEFEKRYVHIQWKESGGPQVTSPTRQGFGTRMIERSLRAEGGAARLSYESNGLLCELDIRI